MDAAAQPMPTPDPMQAVCDRCEQVHDPRKCPGHSKRTGDPCRHPRGFRTDHAGAGNCWLHGGNTPNGEKAAEAEMSRMKLRLVGLGDTAIDHIAETMEDEKLPPLVRLRAAMDLADRAGLMPKLVHEHSGPEGGPIPLAVVQAELLERAKAIRAGAVLDAPAVPTPEADR